MAKRISMIMIAIAMMFGLSAGAWALAPPHDDSNNIECRDCHAMHKSGGMMGGALISRNDEQEALCKTCHNPTGQASTLYNVANHNVGGMIVDCGSCHDPHSPFQFHPGQF